MAYRERYKNQSTQIEINIGKETSTKRTPVRKKSEAKMELKGPPFGLYEITMFSPQGQASMTEPRQWHSGTHGGINSFYHQSVFSERISGGNGHHGGESSVLVIQKEKPALVTPEWMEERPSAETKRQNPEDLDIDVLLKYPNSYVPKRNAPDPSKVQYESTIRPEVAKRDNPVPVLQDQFEDDDYQDDENNEDDEYDEFEEVIVIVDVQRKPVWHRGLELPRSEPQKVGVPIQDLLQLPTRRVKTESVQEKLYIDNNCNDITIIDEKIESVQRPAVVQEVQALASIFQGH